jgi:hypothetical protein
VKLQIKERMVDNEVKYVLPKVWVQFTGLPPHLHDYLVIWAVGSILGVTKDVDMVFTRRFDISRIQVLVMNPNLIPQSMNMVIDENLYELKFRVELHTEASNPQPMEMDHLGEDGFDPWDEEEGGTKNQGSKLTPRSSAGGTLNAGPKMGTLSSNDKGTGVGQCVGHMQPIFVLQVSQGQQVERLDSGTQWVEGEVASELGVGKEIEMKLVEGGADKEHVAQEVQGQEDSMGNSELENEPEMSQGEAMSLVEFRKALEEIGEEEEVSKEDDSEASRVEELAAIPEASLELSSVKRRKRWAGEVDELMGFMTEHHKNI